MLLPEQTPNRTLSGRLPKLQSRHRPAAPLYCTLNSECGLSGPLSAWLQSAEYCCSINICIASSLQQLLHAWNDLDPLNSELFIKSIFNMDVYIDAPLECGVVRHNRPRERAILLFWEGLEYKGFVLKKWKQGLVSFLFSYQVTRVENGTIPMVSTCSRRVVYGQVKDWFLRSSY